MSQTTLIANGTVVTAEGEFAGDVLIEGETIVAVGRVDAPDGASVIDAGGCFVRLRIRRDPDNRLRCHVPQLTGGRPPNCSPMNSTNASESASPWK